MVNSMFYYNAAFFNNRLIGFFRDIVYLCIKQYQISFYGYVVSHIMSLMAFYNPSYQTEKEPPPSL